MDIALIDNNDSFTYNIVELIRKITDKKIQVFSAENLDVEKLNAFDKLIFSPGPGLPEHFPVMYSVLEKYGTTKKILGICLGHQAICKFFGAKLINLDNVVHGQSKKIHILNNDGIFSSLPSEIIVGLYHSWVVDKENFPSEIEITSQCQAGNIMSVKHRRFGIYGVQFHPESFITTFGEQIIANFLNL